MLMKPRKDPPSERDTNRTRTLYVADEDRFLLLSADMADALELWAEASDEWSAWPSAGW